MYILQFNCQYFLISVGEVVVWVGLHLIQVGEVGLSPFVLVKVTLLTEDSLPILKPSFVMDKATAFPADRLPIQDVDLPTSMADFLFKLFEGDVVWVVVWFTGYVEHPEDKVNPEEPSRYYYYEGHGISTFFYVNYACQCMAR